MTVEEHINRESQIIANDHALDPDRVRAVMRKCLRWRRAGYVLTDDWANIPASDVLFEPDFEQALGQFVYDRPDDDPEDLLRLFEEVPVFDLSRRHHAFLGATGHDAPVRPRQDTAAAYTAAASLLRSVEEGTAIEDDFLSSGIAPSDAILLAPAKISTTRLASDAGIGVGDRGAIDEAMSRQREFKIRVLEISASALLGARDPADYLKSISAARAHILSDDQFALLTRVSFAEPIVWEYGDPLPVFESPRVTGGLMSLMEFAFSVYSELRHAVDARLHAMIAESTRSGAEGSYWSLLIEARNAIDPLLDEYGLAGNPLAEFSVGILDMDLPEGAGPVPVTWREMGSIHTLDNFRNVYIRGERFDLTPQIADYVGYLIDNTSPSSPWTAHESVMTNINSASNADVSDLFRSRREFQSRFIQTDARGNVRFRLN